MNPSKDPPVPIAELTLVEWARYDWHATGSQNTYVYKRGDKCYKVVHCDIRKKPDSPNRREAGWEQAQEIDSHRYTQALERAKQCPPIPEDIYRDPPRPEAAPVPKVSLVED